MPRLMLLSHGHPQYSHGGAEIGAYAIHSLFRKGALPGWDSVFVARVERSQIGHDGVFGTFRGRPDEIVVTPPPVDGFFFQSLDRAKLFTLLEDLVRHVRPDVVHAHNFAFWGADVADFFHAKGIAFVFTMHEYIPICHRFGQMLKTNGRLCYQASPTECHLCFPDITSGMFFLRQQIFLEHLKRVARLVSPSRFLAERVEAWSKGALSVAVIENPRDLSIYEPLLPGQGASLPAGREARLLRLGYFGQLNQFKGIEVLLDAVRILVRREVPVRLRLFGANLNIQEPAFRERVTETIAALDDAVEFFGPYNNTAVLRLMASCDAVVMPSIWWENSPIVIQEAIQAGVPMIASRLGGIEEKLRDYPKATFFEVASPLDLAEKIGDFYRTYKSGRKPSQHIGDGNRDTTQDFGALTKVYEASLSL